MSKNGMINFNKINKDNIYVGNIMKCTKYDSSGYMELDNGGVTTYGNISKNEEIYKENQILINVCLNPELYVNVDDLKNILSLLKIYKCLKKGVDDKKLLSTISSFLGDKYVKRDSLVPYYTNNGTVSVKKLKKDLLMDPRIMGGIEN